MKRIAGSFHVDSLAIAVDRLDKTGDVPPQIRVLKGDEVYEISTVGMKYEVALNIVEKQMKPDAVNLIAMAWSRPPFPGDAAINQALKKRLFVMTFDRLGGRWVSLFDVHKDEEGTEIEDVAFGYDGASNVSIHTADNGDLEVMLSQQSAH
ncbi:MAG: hypothetical protein JRM99_01500 [Nitrososphaerota archaeon]|nr:hypothetical protein [Nitrososphaerota archaeon]